MKYKRKSTSTSTKRIVKKAISKAKKHNLTTLIKKVVRRDAETKIAVYQDGFEFGSGTITASNIIPITPYGSPFLDIDQGNGQGDRAGNRIRTKSCVLRYTLYPAPYNAVSNTDPKPMHVRLWFFSVKNNQTLLASNPPNFIQNGDSSTSLTGTLTDLNRIMNNDVYTYLGHRTHKIGTQNVITNTVTSLANNQYFQNNDFKYNQQGFVNCTKMCPKQIKFNDTDNVPTTKLVMVLWECVNADGSSQGALQLPCFINFQVTFKYTDL